MCEMNRSGYVGSGYVAGDGWTCCAVGKPTRRLGRHKRHYKHLHKTTLVFKTCELREHMRLAVRFTQIAPSELAPFDL